MMYYKPYRTREGSVGSDTSNPSDSGRSTLRKKLVTGNDEPQSPNDSGRNTLRKKSLPFVSIGGESQQSSSNIRIERSGTIDKDSKAIPSPVSSPKFNVRDIVDPKQNNDQPILENQNNNELAVPIPTRSFQLMSSNAMARVNAQPNSNSGARTNNVDRRQIKKRESKAVIPDM